MERIVVAFSRWVLRRRYRFTIVGLDRKDLPTKGVLLLPNHVSLLDPTLVQLAGWETFRTRPLVTKRYIDNKGMKGMFSWLRAIGIPDFFVAKNDEKLRELDVAFDEVLSALDKGGNVLFYPAGRLKTEGNERVRGTSGLHALLQRKPDMKTVLVRTTGLWGSSFSTAVHGRTPDIGHQAVQALKSIFSSFIFFLPKREVKIEFFPCELPKNLDRKELALWLEAWYNAPFGDEGEKLYLRPYHFSKKEAPFKRVVSFPEVKGGDPKLLAEVVALVSEVSGEKVEPDTHLLHDLGLDSLEITDLYTELESKYALFDLYSSELCTPRHIVAQIEGRWRSLRHKTVVKKYEDKVHKFLYSTEPRMFTPIPIQQFLSFCKEHKKKNILFDPQEGAISYNEIVNRIKAYAKQFAGREEINLLLPAGADAFCAKLAAHLIGKKPNFLDEGATPGYFTTREAIYLMHGVKILEKPTYLEKGPVDKMPQTQPIEIDLVDEDLVKNYMVNTLYKNDKELSLKVAYHCISRGKPHLFVSSLTPNTRWEEFTSRLSH